MPTHIIKQAVFNNATDWNPEQLMTNFKHGKTNSVSVNYTEVCIIFISIMPNPNPEYMLYLHQLQINALVDFLMNI